MAVVFCVFCEKQADGRTPLFMASVNGHVEAVVALVGAGATVNQATVSADGGAMRMFARVGCELCVRGVEWGEVVLIVGFHAMSDGCGLVFGLRDRGCGADGWSDASACGECEWTREGSRYSCWCGCDSEPGYGECRWRSNGNVCVRGVLVCYGVVVGGGEFVVMFVGLHMLSDGCGLLCVL
jgi:hypothetical protein